MAIAAGTDPELPEGFEVPFAATARYFRMEWKGSCYCRSSKEGLTASSKKLLKEFSARVGNEA